MSICREIMVTTTFVGIHAWSDAPVDVWFLKNEHRHLFTVKICIGVSGGDREKEFFYVKYELDKLVATILGKMTTCGIINLNQNSCEDISLMILDKMRSIYQDVHWVEVWEDLENGARVSVS